MPNRGTAENRPLGGLVTHTEPVETMDVVAIIEDREYRDAIKRSKYEQREQKRREVEEQKETEAFLQAVEHFVALTLPASFGPLRRKDPEFERVQPAYYVPDHAAAPIKYSWWARHVRKMPKTYQPLKKVICWEFASLMVSHAWHEKILIILIDASDGKAYISVPEMYFEGDPAEAKEKNATPGRGLVLFDRVTVDRLLEEFPPTNVRDIIHKVGEVI